MRENEMTIETEKWSGEGTFTQVLIEHLKQLPEIAAIHVEDAPASRSDADYNFISNEIFVQFATEPHQERSRKWGVLPVTRTTEVKRMSLETLQAALAQIAGVGDPDYGDAGMLQYLRTERIIPPYQTRGYKLVELVRLYEFGTPSRA
jgi:hypothetical protein